MAGYGYGRGYDGMGQVPVPVPPGYDPGVAGPYPYPLPYGCFAPAVQPLPIQQVQEPLAFLRARCPQAIQTRFMGFERKKVPAGNLQKFCCCVNSETKVIRLFFKPDEAAFLLVHQIEVGDQRLIDCGPIPAEMFLPDANDVLTINTETIQRGEAICIVVENIGDADMCVSPGAVIRKLLWGPSGGFGGIANGFAAPCR
jgi:hypothetical protein